MRPVEVLMHLRNAWLQEPQRALTLTLCPACRDALCNDLDSMFVPVDGLHSRGLEGSQVMGFTFSGGQAETCALHALLEEEYAP